MGVIDSIKKGFGVAAKSSQLILLIFGFGFIWNVINLPFQNGQPNPAASIGMFALGIVFIAASIFVQAGSLAYLRDVAKTGSASFAVFKEAGRQYYWRILGVALIVLLFILLLVFLGILALLVSGGTANALSIAVGVVLVIVAIIGVFFLFYAPYAVIVDNQSIAASIKSSIAFVKGNILPLAGIGLILILVGIIIGLLLGVLLGLLTAAVTGLPGQIVTNFVSSAINAYLGIVTTGAFMAFYLGRKSA